MGYIYALLEFTRTAAYPVAEDSGTTMQMLSGG
jgi:hypothetical protein